MEASDMARLKELEEENRRLKKMSRPGFPGDSKP